MRQFSYITLSELLKNLKAEGLQISRQTFYRFEQDGLVPTAHRSAGGWRVYTPAQVQQIIGAFKSHYHLYDSRYTGKTVDQRINEAYHKGYYEGIEENPRIKKNCEMPDEVRGLR